MKSRCIVYLIFTLFLFSSCTTTTLPTIYSEQQIVDGVSAIKEMMSEAYIASIDKTRDAISPISNDAIFNETQGNQFIQSKDLPGVEKRLEAFKNKLVIELNIIFDSLFEETKMWIDETSITSPYDYILGENNSITQIFDETISTKLKAHLIRKLSTNERLNSSFTDYYTIINAYIRTGRTELDSSTERVINKWDPSNFSTYLVNIIVSEMATQEEIIRYLAPSYDSPYIRLFSK